jgi:hypothetical protein
MSPELPARPNLEHLRNEAKRLLQSLRRDDPDARLSDAQLQVARAYGFASWRQLKVHVDERSRQRVFEAARAGDVQAVDGRSTAVFIPARSTRPAAPSINSRRSSATPSSSC